LIVARIILTGLLDPSDFVKMSPTPASSSTARTGPPEITPVPSAAGFINTLPEPKRPLISCGIVVPTIGTSTRPFFALRSEEHTSELQSRFDLVCRLLLEKKKDLYHA